ncbi:BAG family molecular chaperone regulator 2 isoform X1 [Hermetia illucens]|nr:BAG family molecular chaperone regulator 2 isoform X1 [Hermetia illucens]XP_037909156.1 BAG family molecular chaperone regulator 2 isoform X1 [Hermetia illucens]
MEVDPAQEMSSSSSGQNFEASAAAASTSTSIPSLWEYPKSGEEHVQIDDRNVIDRPFNLNERFVSVLDQLDSRVEKLRKEAVVLQEKRDYLLMSIDLIKNNELLHGMHDHEREEIFYYIQRVNSRLSTVELMVKTVRDPAQEDSLHQVNMLIDSLITNNDSAVSRQRCQTFLNACSGSDPENQSVSFSGVDRVVDKTFESALLGCTLDDQKNIKKRLQALMNYLNKQIVSD